MLFFTIIDWIRPLDVSWISLWPVHHLIWVPISLSALGFSRSQGIYAASLPSNVLHVNALDSLGLV